MTEQRIELTCPLPPPSLRKNSRAGWRQRAEQARLYSWEVNQCYQAWLSETNDALIRLRIRAYPGETVSGVVGGPEVFWLPWPRAIVAYEWRYCGAQPDQANIPANVAVLQDILCMAPDNGSQSKRCYLGICENDRDLIPSWSMKRVSHKSDECVVVIIER